MPIYAPILLLMWTCGAPPRERAVELERRAYQAFDEGDYEASAKFFREAQKIAPDYASLFAKEARAIAKIDGRCREAHDVFGEALATCERLAPACKTSTAAGWKPADESACKQCSAPVIALMQSERSEVAKRCQVLISILSDPPGARVKIDGISIGTTPVKTAVLEGWHLLTIDRDGYHPIEESVEQRRPVLPEDVPKLERRLKPILSEIIIVNLPAGAFVSVDGKQIADLSTGRILTGAGRRAIQISAPAGEPYTWTMELALGDTQTIDVLPQILARGTADLRARRYREARAHLEPIAHSPSAPRWVLRDLAEAEWHLGDDAKTLEHLGEYLAKTPEEKNKALEILTKRHRALEAVIEAAELAKRGEQEKSCKRLEEACSRLGIGLGNPNNPDPQRRYLVKVADCHRALGGYDRAAAYYDAFLIGGAVDARHGEVLAARQTLDEQQPFYRRDWFWPTAGGTAAAAIAAALLIATLVQDDDPVAAPPPNGSLSIGWRIDDGR